MAAKAGRLAVEYRPRESLKPFPRNPRTHSAIQIGQLAASITAFGWTNPVLIDADSEIIAGHGRVLAAAELGIEQVPVIVLSHLSAPQRRALVVADNKLAMNSGWDVDLLADCLKQSLADGFSLAGLGFDDAELTALLDADLDPMTAMETWGGMPGFNQPNPYFRKIVVNFENEEAVRDFFKVMRQEYSDKAKYIWHPEKPRESHESQRWTSDQSNGQTPPPSRASRSTSRAKAAPNS